MEYILVAIGGALGSITRFTIGKIAAKKIHGAFFVATFFINISGAFLLGMISAPGLDKSIYVLISSGFLGAYTTFSTFMYEGFNLFRDKKKLNAFMYISCSFILGVTGFILGLKVTQSIIGFSLFMFY
jgi:fluoride exporter